MAAARASEDLGRQKKKGKMGTKPAENPLQIRSVTQGGHATQLRRFSAIEIDCLGCFLMLQRLAVKNRVCGICRGERFFWLVEGVPSIARTRRKFPSLLFAARGKKRGGAAAAVRREIRHCPAQSQSQSKKGLHKEGRHGRPLLGSAHALFIAVAPPSEREGASAYPLPAPCLVGTPYEKQPLKPAHFPADVDDFCQASL